MRFLTKKFAKIPENVLSLVKVYEQFAYPMLGKRKFDKLFWGLIEFGKLIFLLDGAGVFDNFFLLKFLLKIMEINGVQIYTRRRRFVRTHRLLKFVGNVSFNVG